MRNFKSRKPVKPLPRGGKSLCVVELCAKGSFTREQLKSALDKIGGTPAGTVKGQPNPVDNWATESFLAPYGIGITFAETKGGKSWRATTAVYAAKKRPAKKSAAAAE